MQPLSSLDKMLVGKTLLIFDFDGTLADTTPLHAEAFTKVLAPLGITVDYPSIAGLKTLDAMHKLLTVSDVSMSEPEISRLALRKQEIVRISISEKLVPLPGVDEFLRWANPRYRLALATSGSRGTVELALHKLGYADLFDPILCADDVIKAKPDPEIFLSILRMAGVHAEQALVFEDAEAGLHASNLAGIDCIDVRETPWLRFTLYQEQAS